MAEMKYILVTGGVISGIGKGIVASSVGTLLKSYGVAVTAIKIDPYINVDAGTFSPYEHGEVYVLDDGGEVDLDLGNYERFLNVTLTRDNNITTGKIYKDVIDRERRGDYLGKTVQVVPHITDAIQEWVERVARIPVDEGDKKPQVCIIELGGTIGDIEGMPFVEAFRQFQFRIGNSNFVNLHVSLVPQPKTTGEQKTKPTQASVRQLRGLGLSPDLVVCRTTSPLTDSTKEKISCFCQVKPDQVIAVHDVSSVYRVPLMLEEQGVATLLFDRLGLERPVRRPRSLITRWKYLSNRYDSLQKEVCIGIVGKYTKLEDAYASVIRALRHAAMASNRKLVINWIEACDLEQETQKSDPHRYHEAWKSLCNSDGVLVPGGFGDRGVEGKMLACGWCRERAVPFLGVCLGLQSAAIEFARSVLGWTDAHSTEMQPDTQHPVVVDMPEHTSGNLGGTMRLGQRTTIFTDADCKIRKLYGGVSTVRERHRHRYEVNPKYVKTLNERGFKFVGHSDDDQRQEIMELEDHPYFVAVQFHPEYLSRPMRPSPPYLGLVLAAANKLESYLSHGCVRSAHLSFTEEDLSDTEEPEENLSTPLASELPKQANGRLKYGVLQSSASLSGGSRASSPASGSSTPNAPSKAAGSSTPNAPSKVTKQENGDATVTTNGLTH